MTIAIVVVLVIGAHVAGVVHGIYAEDVWRRSENQRLLDQLDSLSVESWRAQARLMDKLEASRSLGSRAIDLLKRVQADGLREELDADVDALLEEVGR